VALVVPHESGDTLAAAHAELARCWNDLQADEEYAELALGPDEADAFLADAGTLVDNYFRLEDPNEARAVGIELGVETVVDGMRLRGIIDRLDVTPDGDLIVVDYKTGRAPSERCCDARGYTLRTWPGGNRHAIEEISIRVRCKGG